MRHILKWLLVLAGIILFAYLVMWVTVNWLFHPASQVEDPMVSQAKRAAQLAEIARQQDSAVFWDTSLKVVFWAIVLIGLVGVGSVIALVWHGAKHRYNMEERKAQRDNVIFEPDGNGNYPVVRIGMNGFQVFEPGNPGYINPNPIAALPAPRNRPPTNTLQLNGRSQPFAVEGDAEEDLPPLLPLAKPGAKNRGEQTERTNIEQTVEQKLAHYKSRGAPKTQTIETITLAKRGDNKNWRKWSEYWDSLPGPK